MRNCPICKKRGGRTRHAKNYNHLDTRPENNVMLCFWCHQGLNIVNRGNNWDWEYLFENKREDIKAQAEILIQKDKDKKARLRI